MADLVIKSNFGVLDVLGQKSVAQLSAKLKEGPLFVMIAAAITDEHSSWDGTSKEFSLDIKGIFIPYADDRKITE
jgi:hypothetical protein